MGTKFSKSIVLISCCILIFICIGCVTEDDTTPNSISITSSAFFNWGPIPEAYTCNDLDVSPPLAFSNIPENATSLALLMEDNTAPSGDFVHWIVWNIPKNTTSLIANKTSIFPQGINDFGNIGYNGPCPPSGTHNYLFVIYALDTMLTLENGATKTAFRAAITDHILAQGQIIGKYTLK
jgi:Raf kinase inhibitor-like YbhB/YbcL family protein